MKVIVLRKHGDPKVLKVASVSEPHPGPGEVRVHIQSIGLNYAEILSRKGLYIWAPKLPYILGMEAYGEIDEVGEGIKNRQVGEKVIVGSQCGSYSEKIVIREEQALPALDFYTADENAAFAVNYMTAWIALFEMARLRSSDSILIHAAAGGVGTAAVQLAKHYGCSVYGTASHNQKLKLLLDLNIDGAINYKTQAFKEEILHSTDGKGVDVILETVGGDVFRKSLELLQPFGCLVVAGIASIHLKKWNPISWIKTWYDLPRASFRHMAQKSYGVMAFHLGYILPHVERVHQIWEDLTAFIQKHNIHPVVGHTFAFEDMSKAHELMESRKSMGKIVIHV